MVLTKNLVNFGLMIAGYVLTALALYTMAKRRGIKHPWLAWIPVADMWLLGTISDQYRYVAKGQVRNSRKTLLIANVLWIVLLIWALVMILVLYPQLKVYLPQELTSAEELAKLGTMSETEMDSFFEELAMRMSAPTPQVSRRIAMEMLIISIPSLVALVCLVIHGVLFIKCYYDVFASAEPMTAVLRLVLCIVASMMGFPILRGIFVFLCREKDEGMPSRGGDVPGTLPGTTYNP